MSKKTGDVRVVCQRIFERDLNGKDEVFDNLRISNKKERQVRVFGKSKYFVYKRAKKFETYKGTLITFERGLNEKDETLKLKTPKFKERQVRGFIKNEYFLFK